MGKTTGFIEYQRVLPVLRGPAERVRDWSEFHGHLADTTLQEQAGRCMDCGVPFCHTGTIPGALPQAVPCTILYLTGTISFSLAIGAALWTFCTKQITFPSLRDEYVRHRVKVHVCWESKMNQSQSKALSVRLSITALMKVGSFQSHRCCVQESALRLSDLDQRDWRAQLNLTRLVTGSQFLRRPTALVGCSCMAFRT